MPGMSGIEATRRLTAEWPQVKVLVLTMVDDDQGIHAALKAGALGYLLKGAGIEEIGQALAAAGGGHGVFSPAVANRLRRFFASDAAQPFPVLSEREREVLALIAAGEPNAAIAYRLFLSEKTVRNYVSSIFAKLDVPDRAAAIVLAREAGLGERGSA
jgi:DNA-binding NarL/FixJ family response regulator